MSWLGPCRSSEMIVGPGQELGKDVPYLYHSAGTLQGWGGPATSPQRLRGDVHR